MFVFFLLVISLSAAEPQVLWSGVTSGGVYCSTGMGDLNGDGVPDVACGVNFWDSQPTIWAISGADGSTIWTSSDHKGIYQNEGFTGVPDMDGDGLMDLLVATPGGYEPPGRCLYLISGADGSTVWEWAACETMPVSTGWGYSCTLLDDINADGVDECVGGFGTSGSSNTGLVACIDGASGDSLWTVWIPDAAEDLHQFIDGNADGVNDILLAVGGNSYTGETARLISGADGSTLWQRNPGGDCMSVGILERPDTYPLAVFSTFSGAAGCYDAGGSLQWDYSGSGMFLDVRGGPDVNGDGTGDVALAADNAGAVCISGDDGEVLWSVYTGSNTWSVAWLDTVILGGMPVPCVAAGSVNGKKVVLINACTGETVWETEFQERVYNVSAVDLGMASMTVIAGLQDQQPLPDHAWALAGSMETGITHGESSGSLFSTVNPSHGSIVFHADREGSMDLECFDLTGRLVFRETLQPSGGEGSRVLAPGVYLIRVSGGGITEIHRVTVL